MGLTLAMCHFNENVFRESSRLWTDHCTPTSSTQNTNLETKLYMKWLFHLLITSTCIYLYTFEYKPPYYEFINGDPDENIMKQVVCEQKHRPLFNPLWKQNVIMNELTRLTEELWVEMPNARLNALRLKKSINKIRLINVEKC